MRHFSAICGILLFALLVPSMAAENLAPPNQQKLLLIFPKEEVDTAIAACRADGLQFDVADSFNKDKDYGAYSVIVSGSNKMDYWEKAKEENDFSHIDAFMKNGGHLCVFGSWNGRNMEHLQQYGIITGLQHHVGFEAVEGVSDLLFKGNENLVPKTHALRSVGDLKCSGDYVALLKRGGTDQYKDDPVFLTRQIGKGRLSVNLVEPVWRDERGTPDAFWLITCTISWIARGCPDGTVIGNDGQHVLSDELVKATQNQWIGELANTIADGRKRIFTLPLNSNARNELADSIRAWTQKKSALEKMSVSEMRQEIAAERDRQTAKAQAAAEKRAAEEAAAKAAADQRRAELKAKFNGWEGPWKVCPVCHGTGRDEIAEREANMRTLEVAGAQTAGTGMFRKLPGAVIPCDACGGTGQVPDYSR